MFIQHKSGQNPVSTHRQCYKRFYIMATLFRQIHYSCLITILRARNLDKHSLVTIYSQIT